jgi:hypothetical protein
MLPAFVTEAGGPEVPRTRTPAIERTTRYNAQADG